MRPMKRLAIVGLAAVLFTSLTGCRACIDFARDCRRTCDSRQMNADIALIGLVIVAEAARSCR